MAAKAKTNQPKPTPTEQALLFGQLLDHLGPMPVHLASRILTIKPTKEDRERLADLLARNGEGGMEAADIEEMDDRVRAGTWLAILHSMARAASSGSKRREVALA